MSRAVAALLPLFFSIVALSAPVASRTADWALSAPELAQLEKGGIVAEGDATTEHAAADVRAAVKVAASPEQVFRALTDCSRALHFVPHLKRCRVVETAPDGSWQNVEQTVDYGWLAPRASYVFHAAYEKFSRIRFSNVRGDFRENRGVWTFHPSEDGQATVVTYEAHVAPAFYVPRWMMRNMLKRDLPDLMRGLRANAENPHPVTATNAPVPPGP